MAEPISAADRQLAIERLAEIETELGQIATWLALGDLDKASILLESATRDIMAACWSLTPPVRTRPAGWLNGSQSG